MDVGLGVTLFHPQHVVTTIPVFMNEGTEVAHDHRADRWEAGDVSPGSRDVGAGAAQTCCGLGAV